MLLGDSSFQNSGGVVVPIMMFSLAHRSDLISEQCGVPDSDRANIKNLYIGAVAERNGWCGSYSTRRKAARRW